MIYEAVDHSAPIRQGDIFVRLPKTEISLQDLTILNDSDELVKTSWSDLADASDELEFVAVLGIEAVTAIVITQDCDASRGKYISLCQISKFEEATNLTTPSSPDKWQSFIVKFCRTNPRFFYLPVDNNIGFKERMVTDFRDVIRLPLEDLRRLRTRRMCRLTRVASEHFRESIGQFYGRYPYNEWYPLTKEEFEAYAAKSQEEIQAYEWQK